MSQMIENFLNIGELALGEQATMVYTLDFRMNESYCIFF